MRLSVIVTRFAVALLLCRSVGPASAAEFDWSPGPLTQDHVALFRVWVPDEPGALRAIITLTPGANGDSRDWIDDPDWQRLAHAQHTALLGMSLRGSYGGAYFEVSHWSGALILRAFDELGRLAGHPELAHAPLAMWGFSAGGMVSYEFACWQPDRVLGFVMNKGGILSGRANDTARRIPGLWIMGQNDEDRRLEAITDLFAENRRIGARWALAVEPNSGHEVGRTKELGIVFLESVLTTMDRGGPGPGWIGDLTTHDIRETAPAPSTNRPRLDAWLPDEHSARAWKMFVEGRMPTGPFLP